MKPWKVTVLGIATITLVACATQGNVMHGQNSKTKSIETKKDPKIISAEQLAFVLCKKKQGQYQAHHDKDMRKVLSTYNIDSSILESGEVKSLAQKYANDVFCSASDDFDRIGDMVPKAGEGKSQFKKIIGWEREVVVAISEGECKTQLGEFDDQERENFALKKLDEILYPSDLDEDEIEVAIKRNIPSILWLTLEKKGNQNCSWIPG